jgi:hypothetical protein
MKKSIFLVVLIALTATVFTFAQSDSTKFLQKIQEGMIVGVSGTTDFSDIEKPFDLDYGLMANVTLVAKNSYCNLMYGFGDNSVKILAGYFIPKDCDVYIVYSKGLSLSNDYLGIGLEKLVRAGGADFFLFSELGTDFKGNESLTLGVLFAVQNVFWRNR